MSTLHNNFDGEIVTNNFFTDNFFIINFFHQTFFSNNNKELKKVRNQVTKLNALFEILKAEVSELENININKIPTITNLTNEKVYNVKTILEQNSLNCHKNNIIKTDFTHLKSKYHGLLSEITKSKNSLCDKAHPRDKNIKTNIKG